MPSETKPSFSCWVLKQFVTPWFKLPLLLSVNDVASHCFRFICLWLILSFYTVLRIPLVLNQQKLFISLIIANTSEYAIKHTTIFW